MPLNNGNDITAPRFAPDPFVAAQLFTTAPDEAISTVLVKFDEFIVQSPWSEALCLWYLRGPLGKAKARAHLEIFVQGPAEGAFASEARVREALFRFFYDYYAQEQNRHIQSTLIDSTDMPRSSIRGEEITTSPLATILEFPYRRNPEIFAGSPFISDDIYVSLFTECLSKSAKVLLQELRGANTLPQSRQTLFLRFLVAGLAMCAFSAEEQGIYFKYHRDWVLRFPFWYVKRPAAEFQEAARRSISRYEAHIEANREKLAPCLMVAQSFLREQSKSVAGLKEGILRWQHTFHSVFRRIDQLHRRPDFYRDPYAAVPIFSMIFKVFNMISNQLGLHRQEEAFVTHLLCRSLTGIADGCELAY